MVSLVMIVTGLGCSDLSGLAGKQELPAGTPDPASLHNRSGALAAYQGVLALFQSNTRSQAASNGTISTFQSSGTFVEFVLNAGLLTDELASGRLGGNQTNYDNFADRHSDLLLDTRQLREGTNLELTTDLVYRDLQALRNSAHLAIAALAMYDTVDSPALRGHLYALAGLSELFLADLYCSGVPLSTLDAQGDFTYRAGVTTSELYHAAIAQFDSALTLSPDSLRFLYLAQVGIGRAYLALGKYDSAAAAVHSVPTAFTYQVVMNWQGSNAVGGGLFATEIQYGVTVVDQQGGVGLPYLSSEDPRSASATWGNNRYLVPQYAPVAYGGAALGTSAAVRAPITVASGIEARLIEAEAALHGVGTAGSWLTILNALRTNGTGTTIPAQTLIDTLGVTQCGATLCGGGLPGALAGTGGSTPEYGQPNGGFPGYVVTATTTTFPAPETGAPDGGRIQDYCNNNSWYEPCYAGDSMVVLTLTKPASIRWSAGMGGVAGLAPLTDPGSTAEDVALLFQERAYWLFLTGHRQGDLRRLVRNYQLDANAVYPTGAYPLFEQFQQFVSDVNAPIPTDEHANPHFAGCLSRGA
jgi:hypothetical protein